MITCPWCKAEFTPPHNAPNAKICQPCFTVMLGGFIADTEWCLAEADRLDGKDAPK